MDARRERCKGRREVVGVLGLRLWVTCFCCCIDIHNCCYIRTGAGTRIRSLQLFGIGILAVVTFGTGFSPLGGPGPV